jgi:beta-mannosidase
MTTTQDDAILTRERSVDLRGGWTVAPFRDDGERDAPPRTESHERMTAAVPTSVHYDLIAAGKLQNPFASSAAADAASWVAGSDWVFERTVRVEPDFAAAPELALDFEGVDTFSDVWLNGVLLGRTANAYRSYRFHLPAGLAREGDNDLVVHVKAHSSQIADRVAAAREHLYTSRNPYSYKGKSLLRRYQRSFFGGASLINLGTEILGIGIYKPVRLVALPAVQIAETHFRVLRATAERADASLSIAVDSGAATGRLTATASLVDPLSGETVARASGEIHDRRAQLALAVDSPRLWWPHGYGEQSLYELRLELADDGVVVATEERMVGLRTVELLEERPGQRRTFQFVVNGTSIWVRGQNPIPIDYIAVHGDDAQYDRLLRLVVESNSNLIRIWGGGAIENEHFFDRCDQLGILVWQDFFLHSTTYPDYDAEWVEEFRQESVELVRRLRNHASLALLCGGNEQEQGWDEWGWQGDLDRFYGKPLLYELLPAVAAAEAPEIPYVTNSPHGGAIEASPAEGEMHLWGNYVNATKDALFITETCWNLHSYSRPETLEQTMGIDLDEFAGRGWPGKWTELTKLPLITKYPYSDYFEARTLRGYLKSLEIEHLVADYTALKTLRLTSPSLTGIVNWSFNKGGPLFEFGCVDYLLRPLMNFYAIKRLFADVVVGVYRDIDDIRVVASNVSSAPVDVELRVAHLGSDGRVAGAWNASAALAPGKTSRLLELPGLYETVLDRTREAVQAQLFVDGMPVSTDTVFFVPLAEVEVAPNPVSARLVGSGVADDGAPTWTIELSSPSLQKLVQLEGGDAVIFSDDYFALLPGEVKRVTVTSLEPLAGVAPTITIAGLEAGEEVELTLR